MRFLPRLQQQIRNYFGISQTETNAFLVLLPTLSILLLLFPFYHHLFPSQESDFTLDKEELQKYIAILEESKEIIPEESQPEIGLLSAFNPNTTTFDTLIYAGLDTVTAARLLSYRNAGGVFKTKEDLKKIYGLNNNMYNSIAEYLTLPDEKHIAKAVSNYKPNEKAKDQQRKSAEDYKNKKEIETLPLKIDINTADSLKLMKIRGIGPVLSSRIIRYRDLLGGFSDTVQYKDVYGLSEEVLKQMYSIAVIEKDFIPTAISINESTAADLAKHPYMSWTIANAIISYKKQHGRFTSIDQLKEIKLIDEELYNKLKVYLSL